MEIFLISITSYLLGSIPFGFLLTKIFLDKDIRKIGSGNIGATTALRTGNKTIGYSTFLLDILKAIITVLFVKNNYSEYLFVSSLCVFLGHVFPVWLKFKGGKGVASYVGILFCINPIFGLILVFLPSAGSGRRIPSLERNQIWKQLILLMLYVLRGHVGTSVAVLPMCILKNS